MKYVVRPKAWLDIEESMTWLRARADDQTAIRFWQKTQETFAALARQPAGGFEAARIAFLAGEWIRKMARFLFVERNGS